jgi:peptide subunit release factor 1 (eRF1)
MALQDIDLRQLAEMNGAERAFVSLYISGTEGLQKLRDREEKVRRLLQDAPEELEHFDESLRMIREALEEHPPKDGMALFASWALDFLAGYRLEVAPPDILWVDSSPYLRPLATLQDDHSRFILVSADAGAARVHVVSATVPTEVDRIRGDVKNHVKKGGWSQKRYQRRRSNEMLLYAREVAEAITRVADEEAIDRIVLLGAQEATAEIAAALPDRLQSALVAQQTADVSDENALLVVAQELVEAFDKDDARGVWERIRSEAIGDGLAAVGPSAVLAAAQQGRIDTMVATREAKLGGVRCRDCECLAFAKAQQCPACKSNSVFAVDLINELVELVAMTGGSVEFVEPIDTLEAEGHVAGLLRY